MSKINGTTVSSEVQGILDKIAQSHPTVVQYMSDGNIDLTEAHALANPVGTDNITDKQDADYWGISEAEMALLHRTFKKSFFDKNGTSSFQPRGLFSSDAADYTSKIRATKPHQPVIRYDITDQNIEEFLRIIGLERQLASDEPITFSTLEASGIDLEAFAALFHESLQQSPQSSKCRGYYIIDPEKIKTVLTTFTKQQIKQLIRSDNSVNGAVAQKILHNALPDSPYRTHQTVLQKQGSNDALKAMGFSDTHLSGIQFLESSANTQALGNAIVRVNAGQYSGSALLLTDEGHVASAAHVFYDDNFVFEDPITIHYNGDNFPITKDMVMAVNHSSDIILLKVPDLSKQEVEWAKIGSAVREEANAIAIGFPIYEKGRTIKKAYSLGKVSTIEATTEEMIQYRVDVKTLDRYQHIVQDNDELLSIEDFKKIGDTGNNATSYEGTLTSFSTYISPSCPDLTAFELTDNNGESLIMSFEEAKALFAFSRVHNAQLWGTIDNVSDYRKVPLIRSTTAVTNGNSGGALYAKSKNGTWQAIGLATKKSPDDSNHYFTPLMPHLQKDDGVRKALQEIVDSQAATARHNKPRSP